MDCAIRKEIIKNGSENPVSLIAWIIKSGLVGGDFCMVASNSTVSH